MNNNINNNDSSNLKLLSIFHYIYGGFSLFVFVSWTIFFLSFYIPLLSGDTSSATSQYFTNSNSRKQLIDLSIAVTLFLLVFIGFAICIIVSGNSLNKRKNYWFSFVIACLECLSVPLGTALGVYTIISLQRDSVKKLYNIDTF
ncbi:MAG: hypothetical protein ACRC80_04945 [Waterburya sp.]